MQTESFHLIMGNSDSLRIPKLTQNIEIREKRNELGIVEESSINYQILVKYI